MNLAEWLLILVSAFTMLATIALAATGWKTLAVNREWLKLAQAQLAQVAEEVQAVGAQAEATRLTVDEMRRDREYALAPFLRVTREAVASASIQFGVENIGRGPALNCRLAHVEFAGQWSEWSSELFTLGPGECRMVSASTGSRWHDAIVQDVRLSARESPHGITVCVCEDQLGIKSGSSPHARWKGLPANYSPRHRSPMSGARASRKCRGESGTDRKQSQSTHGVRS